MDDIEGDGEGIVREEDFPREGSISAVHSGRACTDFLHRGFCVWRGANPFFFFLQATRLCLFTSAVFDQLFSRTLFSNWWGTVGWRAKPAALRRLIIRGELDFEENTHSVDETSIIDEFYWEAMVAILIANLVATTVITATDLLIIFTAIITGEIKRHLLLHIIFVAMVIDVLVYLNNVAHDVPSFMLGEDIFKTPEAAFASIIVLCCQWFGQLFFLLVLSFIHFIAVFFPSLFRAISTKNIHVINLTVIIVNVLLTIPLLTPYCGFSYFAEGNYWSFDTRKPYTYIYKSFNTVLQIGSAVVVALVDSIIIWKLYQLRSVSHGPRRDAFTTSITRTTHSTPARGNNTGISREMRIALNFLLLSGCFLAQAITYNLPYEKSDVSEIIKKVFSKLNLAKWAIYALGSASIRNGVLRLLMCRRAAPESPKTVLTRS